MAADDEDEEGALDPKALEAAFYVSSEASAFLTTRGGVLLANPALCALTLLDPADLQGRSFLSLFAEKDRPGAETVLRQSAAWSEAAGPKPLLLQRARVPVDLAARVFVTRGGGRFVQVTLRDARERRRAEQLHATLMAAGRTANAAADLRELGRGLAGVVREILPRSAGVAVFGREEDALVTLAEDGFGQEWVASHGRQPLAGATLVADAARRRETILIVDAALESPTHDATLPPGTGSILVAPVGGDETLGAILVRSEAGVRLDLDDLRSLEIVAAEMASATRRLLASRRLAAIEREYAAVVEHARDAMFVLDEAGRIVGLNPRALRSLGDGDEARAREQAEALLRPQGADGTPFLREVLAQERATLVRTVVAQGRARRVRLHGTLADTVPPRVVVLVEDVTLEARSRRLRDLVASFHAWLAGHGAGGLDLPDLLAKAAAAVEAQAGACLVREENGRRHVAAAQGEAWRAGPPPDLRQAFAAGPAGAPRVVESSGPAGRFHVTVLAAPMEPDRDVVLLLAHAWDEGAPFSEEDEPWLRLAQEELDRVLRHQRVNEELRLSLDRERAQHARLRRLHEEMEEFTLWTTHDLREPLRSLATLVEMLKEEAERLGSREAEELASKVRASATTIKERLRAIHDFSVASQPHGPRGTASLDAVLGEIVESLGEDAARVAVHRPLPTVEAERERLSMALHGLLQFALERTPPDARVTVSAREDDGAVEVGVESGGPQIPARLHGKLFHLFYQLPDEPPRQSMLPLARRIALQHGGSLRAQNVGGRTRLVMRLPRGRTALAPGMPPRDAAAVVDGRSTRGADP